MKKSYYLLSQIDSATGNYKQAYRNYIVHTRYKDSIFNENSSRQIAEMQTKYETAKKNQQIELLEMEKDINNLRLRNNKVISYVVIVSLIIVFTFLFIFYRIRLKKDEEKLVMQTAMEAENRERKRISEDLHDGIGPLLSTVKMYVNEIENNDSKNKNFIEKSSEILDEAITSVRSISHNLVPPNLDQKGLVESLKSFTKKVTIGNNLQINLETNLNTDRYGKWQEVAIYRIITELINNSIKHAKFNKIDFSIDKDTKYLLIKYTDDGKGADIDKILKSDEGLGLKNIVSRTKSLKGKIEFDSKIDKGFNVKIRFTLKNLM